MRCTERTPIDDDAENAEIRPLEACIPLSIQGKNLQYKFLLAAAAMLLRYKTKPLEELNNSYFMKFQTSGFNGNCNKLPFPYTAPMC